MSDRSKKLLLALLLSLLLVAVYTMVVTSQHRDAKSGQLNIKECQPVTHWVICDDGFVVFDKGIVNTETQAKLCGEHGAKDHRQIHIQSTQLGKNWRIVVTPVNEPVKSLAPRQKPSEKLSLKVTVK
jgi:hypothetical protein